MRYTGSLVKKERELIFELFLHRNQLSFHEIESHLRIRSNLVSYHLQQMLKEGVLKKSGMHYELTPSGERYLPIFTHITGKELSPLPIVLVAIKKGPRILLLKRNKRPYKNYWSLIGGKMRQEENIEEAAERLTFEKTGLHAKTTTTHAILHERIFDEGKLKFSFILFLLSSTLSRTAHAPNQGAAGERAGELKWFSLNAMNPEIIIPSDHWLIMNKLSSHVPIIDASMQEHDGVLSKFKISSNQPYALGTLNCKRQERTRRSKPSAPPFPGTHKKKQRSAHS
jgi:8-oxo-dGTP diphosphatase